MREEWVPKTWSRTVDEPWFALPRESGVEGTCRLQVLESSAGEVLFVATQASMKEGISLTRAARWFIRHAWQTYAPNLSSPPTLVEHYIRSSTNRRNPWADATAVDLNIAADGGESLNWRRLTPDDSQGLRMHAQPDRGKGLEDLLVEPYEYVTIWTDFPVARLPPTRPFRTTCMPKIRPETPPKRWFRRPLPPEPYRPIDGCCWYHAGSWKRANAVIRSVLRRLETENQEDYGQLIGRVDTVLRSMELDRWTMIAARSLVSPVIEVYEDFSAYTNGQHRAQAMIDQDVATTVVTYGVELEAVDERPGRYQLPEPRG